MRRWIVCLLAFLAAAVATLLLTNRGVIRTGAAVRTIGVDRVADYGQPLWANPKSTATVNTYGPTVHLADFVASEKPVPELEDRAAQFFLAWKKEEGTSIYAMLSSDIRESLDRHKYLSDLKLFFDGTRLMGFRVVGSQSTSETQAIVQTELVLSIREDGDKRIENRGTHNSRWVREKDSLWYFDGVLGSHQRAQ
jgi:hypothetical protein